MIASPPCLTDVAIVFPRPDGDVLVVPHVLPFRVPGEALMLTAAEWLGIPGGP
ncbi:hypothetical protein [Planotetraspora kaengkrachanensis]|uniref:Uncharacterized protein n=1 Tax=Planotetraspora kaengkrachanensis TaxID=575193 RepID=A0A8J3V754_9ACTN|nr:hypothetical protein [Planotetraspora kaengkrachanensis]GIG81446.1 hypothetical protein Pka01_45730 [Planotetraspora kaengkrachanensis]